jgi:hypothetical protein
MDSNTLNGFEVFEDFMPGSVANKNTFTEEIDNNDLGGATEELTDEELEAIRNPKKNEDNNSDSKEQKDNEKSTTTKSRKDSKVDNEIVEEDDEEPEGEDIYDDGSSSDDNIDTSNVVTSFFEALSDKMGWELDEDEEIPQTPEELVEYFKDVIEENSVPQYASEEVEALDNFVKNGGNLRDYFQIDGDLDLEEINIEDSEVNQKLVIKEFLKEKGFNAKQIEKKLTKYEEAGLLEDEATDALEALRDIKEQKKQELLEAQEKRAKELKKRQQEQFNTVVSELKGMDNIRGIKIPQKDK